MRDQQQDLADGEPAGGGRPHAADLMGAIGDADRFALDHRVAGEIVQREQAGIVGKSLTAATIASAIGPE
jgi:hypothetical protein